MAETPQEPYRPAFDNFEQAARYWMDMHDYEWRRSIRFEAALCKIRDFVKRWPGAVHFSNIRTICEKALDYSEVKDVNPGMPDQNAGYAGPEEE